MTTTTEPDDQSLKPNRRMKKTRQVSSRFLSPSSTPSRDMVTPSPNTNNQQSLSPLLHHHRKSSASTDTRKHEDSGSVPGLWPSSTVTTSSSKNKNLGTLAEHLGNERLKDYLDRKTNTNDKKSSVFSLTRQTSCTEIGRFENCEKEKQNAKENHKPLLGGSMRYTGGKLKLKLFPSSNSSSNSEVNIVPARFSMDETSLYRKSNGRRSDTLLDNLDQSECYSDICSTSDFTSSPAIGKSSSSSSQSFQKSGIEVSSKYMQDVPSKLPRRMNSDSNIQINSADGTSPKSKKFTIKNAIKRANSITGYGTTPTSQWALSPGRSASPPMSVESKHRPMSFSSLKPPTSPSKAKGVEKLLHMGLDLFKNKKTSSSSSSLYGDVENVHKLRLLHNRLMQWHFANARANEVHCKITNQVENNLVCAWDSLAKLRHSVVQKRLQLEKKKLDMKLDFIVQSQIKLLESWGDMERQHMSAVSMTKEYLHHAVCKVPLIEGAKADPESVSIALRHASDLSTSIESLLATFWHSTEKTVSLLSKLAETITQERMLIEECLELLGTIVPAELHERSLHCYIIQMQSQLQRQKKQDNRWLASKEEE